MKDYLLICTCSGREKKAREALAIIKPDLDQDDITLAKGKEQISRVANEHNNDHLKAISKLTGNYSYYVRMDGDKIIEEWELIKMRRIA